MKKIFLILLILSSAFSYNAKAGCAPGEAYIEIVMNSDNFVSIETNVIITIGGVVVFDSGVVGGLPADGTTGVILDGCFPEGDIIDISYTDTFGDGILIDPPFFIQNGCDFVASGLADGTAGSVYNAPVNTDADATPQAGNPNGTAAAGCPGGPTTAVNLGTIALSPTLPDNVTPPTFPAGATSYPVCDAAGGDDTGNGTLSGTFTQDFTENFVVCSDWTQPNVTGNETGAYIGAGAATLEYGLEGFNDTDVGTPSINDCGSGFAAIDVFESGTCAPVASGTTTLTGLTPGTTYTVCVEFFASDFGEGPDGQFGTADDEPTADGSCTLQEIFIGVQPFDLEVVCDQFDAELLFGSTCNSVTFAIGFLANPDGTTVNGQTEDPMNYMYTINSTIPGTQVDNIGFFDTDGDGAGDFLGNIVTYTADALEQGCDPVPFPTDITVMCPDGTEATLDAGYGVQTLTNFDVVADFGLASFLYPDVTNFVLTETPGGCGMAAMVTITAPNGDVCFTDTGAVPAEPACDSGLTNSEPLMYDEIFGDSSTDPLATEDCSMQFMATVAADCAALPCMDNPPCDLMAGEPTPPNDNVCLAGTEQPGDVVQGVIDVIGVFGMPTTAQGNFTVVQDYVIADPVTGEIISVTSDAMLDLTGLAVGEQACISSFAYYLEVLELVGEFLEDQLCNTLCIPDPLDPLGPELCPGDLLPTFNCGDMLTDFADLLDLLNQLNNAQGLANVTFDDVVMLCETQVLTINVGDIVGVPGTPDVDLDLTLIPGLMTDGFCCDFSNQPHCLTVVDCSVIQPPVCMISNVGLSASVCTNPNATDDPADDTFVLTINPTGTDIGTTFTYDIGAGPVAGNMYNTPITITLPADGASITVTITDDTDTTCTLVANINAPTECSTVPPVTDIPTLSQWGLITLMLMLMSYGAIAMSNSGVLSATLRRKEEE